MALQDITRETVLAAAKEYDGTPDKSAFLTKYGRGSRSDYMVEINGTEYPSKAIATAAHAYLPGQTALQGVSGGMSGTAARLAELGFSLSDVTPRNPAWTRDELVLALDLYRRKPTAGKTNPEVIQLSELLQMLGKQRGRVVGKSYRNANGVGLKLMNFRAVDPAYTTEGRVGMRRGNSLEPVVWEHYADDLSRLRKDAERIRHYIRLADAQGLAHGGAEDSDETDDDGPTTEGGITYGMHKRYERDRALRRRKIAKAAKTDAKLPCEVCGFSFREAYGEAGEGVAEVHHINPLHLAETVAKTRLGDLAVLCANCHRMAHRGKQARTLGDIRAMLGQKSS